MSIVHRQDTAIHVRRGITGQQQQRAIEFFQPADSGLGVGIIRSQQQLEISRTWGIAVVSTMIGAAAYLLTTFVARVATPWAPKLEV